MLVDHKQLVSLIAATSGIDEDKVQDQIEELVEEIQLAIADDEAYEIDGLGIFSNIGNRILFIPSKELETEINFKYVGMQPIEMDVATSEPEEDDDPFAGLDISDSHNSGRDPFAGLVEDFDEDESAASREMEDENEDSSTEEEKSFLPGMEEEEFKPGPDEWGIDAHREEGNGANKLISSLLREEDEEPPSEEKEYEDPFAEIFGEVDDEEEDKTPHNEETDEVKGVDQELSAIMSDEGSKPLDELEAGMLEEDSDVFADLDQDSSADAQESDDEEHFDDSLDALAKAMEEDDEEDEIIPVIKNISSGLEKKEPAKEEKPKKEKKEKPKKEKKEGEAAPVWLWIVLVLVIGAGTVVGLGYLSIIQVPGITPTSSSSTTTFTTPTPVIPPSDPVTQETNEQNSNDEAMAESGEAEAESAQESAPAQEPESQPEVQPTTPENPTAEAASYGLMGEVNDAANNGFTIVLYSLSNKENAMREQQRLQNRGYRALVIEAPSQQYGTLYRVSIGQFASLRDAALATDDLDESFDQNYFIKKITN
jgi:cell division septation protein DedD